MKYHVIFIISKLEHNELGQVEVENQGQTTDAILRTQTKTF